jgi:endoglucanase
VILNIKTLFTIQLLLYKIIFLCVFGASFFVSNAQLLTVNGKEIINTTNNKEVVLNAMNFGNWMVMEGYMMNSSDQAPDQHTWKQKLTTLIGSQNTSLFYDTWLKNHVTHKDINQIKAWGFNAVRIPVHYEYFVNKGAGIIWNDQGFILLDSIIAWCSAEGIYAVLDLHAAPGGQSDNAISDYDNTKPSLWESESNKTKTVELWKRISERYKNEPWVAGYDLINEPAWNLPNGTDLLNIYQRITNAIRNNGDNHIIFIEGNWYSNDYTGLTPAWDDNMVYVFHKYWSDASNIDIKWITDFREAQNRPIWCGEHGENSNDHFTKIVETFNENKIGFSWWPMKKFESINCFSNAKFPPGYSDLLNYLGGTNPNLNPDNAFNTLIQLAENVKIENCKIQIEVLRSIFVQPGNREIEPFSSTPFYLGNSAPTRLYTPNYDQGMNGYAYSDVAWEDVRLTTGNYTAWNNGWVYRNNGVDIEATNDPLSNGYTVGWFVGGEWMKYTINNNATGTYLLEFRIANGNTKPGILQIQNEGGTEILATVEIPPTGGWSSWQTIAGNCSFGTIGKQVIRIVNISGEFNVSSVNFVYQNTTIIPTVAVDNVLNIIYLKGNNNKYVTWSNDGNLLTSTNQTSGSSEQFIIVDAGEGLTALKGNNGYFVTLNPSDNKLYCSSTEIGDYEKFTLNNLCGAYSIKGYNGLYLSSENGASSGMTCTRKVPAGWEFFNWTVTGTVTLNTEDFENPGESFQVSPNPANNFISVPALFEEKCKIVIFDVSGTPVFNSELNSKEVHLDISKLKVGIYFIKIFGSQKIETIKFVKAY